MYDRDIAEAIAFEYIRREKTPEEDERVVQERSSLMPRDQRMRVKRNRKPLKGMRHIASEKTAKEAFRSSRAINGTYSSPDGEGRSVACLSEAAGDRRRTRDIVVSGIYMWADDNGIDVIIESDTGGFLE